MKTDLPFDLEALMESLGDHSVFAPSGSAMWLFCSGSLIPNLLAEDNAGEDAAYGTVGHKVGETWLSRLKANPFEAYRDLLTLDEWIDSLTPREMIGLTTEIKERHETFKILIDAEMLGYVRQYVKWCVVLPGEHYIETKVYFSQITPIPKQGGTADHAACEPGVLTITDLKMGKGIQVFAKWNTQGILYALGFFYAYDAEYDFQKIVIRIGQPRFGDGHWDVWEMSRDELLEWAEWAKVRAHEAWVVGAPRTPGNKQCQWCKISSTCAAWVAWTHDNTSDIDWSVEGSELSVQPDGTIEGVTYTVKDMLVASESLVSGKLVPNLRDPGAMTTEAMERMLTYRKAMEKWFKSISEELLTRANDGEDLKLWKLVPGRKGDRDWNDNEEDMVEHLDFIGIPEDQMHIKKLISPAKAEEVLRATHPGLKKKDAASLVFDLTVRQDGKPTLALVSDQRKALPDLADDTFEPVSDDDGL